VLATSREALRIANEFVYAVPPMTQPSMAGVPEPGLVAESDAAQLFVARARLAQPGFHIVASNAAAVARICHGLDGIPLALELAAVRLRGLSVGQLEGRLFDSLGVLTGGDRSAHDRHQTLLAAFEWSHALLTESERALFRRLSICSGGWTIAAAAAIGAGGDDALIDLLSLVDKSMVVAEIGEPGRERYRYLDTVRQFGRRQLELAGETAITERRHAEHFRDLAVVAEIEALGPAQEEWFTRLDDEMDNLHSALRWATREDAELGLTIASRLWRYWYVRGQIDEGRHFLDGLLRRGATAQPATYAGALFAATQLAVMQGASVVARPLAETSLAIRRRLGNVVEIGWSMHVLAHCLGDHTRERELLAEAVVLLRSTPDRFGLAWTLHCLGNAGGSAGNQDSALAAYRESGRLFRETGNRWGIALSLVGLGNAAARRGSHGEACSFFEQALTLQRAIQSHYLSDTLNALGHSRLELGEHADAATHFGESLRLSRAQGARWEAAIGVQGLASVSLARGRPLIAARLLAAADMIRQALDSQWSPADEARFIRSVGAAKAAIGGGEPFEEAWALGASWAWAEVLDAALAEAGAASSGSGLSDTR
jgi:predicted ATPase